MIIPPESLEACKRKFSPFHEQLRAVANALQSSAEELSICLIAAFGSVLGGLRPESDIDILVLISGYVDKGVSFLDAQDAVRDCAEAACINDIPLDLHIRDAMSFLDTSHGTEFKRSFSERNMVLWEDGVTIERRFISWDEGF